MELRNGTVVGANLVPQQHHAAFAVGVRLIFQRWTALALAMENQWGGSNCNEKFEMLVQDTVTYFLRKRDHYVDELEEDLDDAILQDFNVEAEDGSPKQVAIMLMDFHQQCLNGDFSMIESMQRAMAEAQASGVTRSQKQVVDRDGTVMDEGSSSDDDDGSDDEMKDADAAPAPAPPREPVAPIIDEDGFEMVQKKGGRRR